MKSSTRLVNALRIIAAVCVSIGIWGCLPGSETALAPVSNRTPSDEVFVKLFESIEGRRADQFILLVSASASPDRDTLYRNLIDFYAGADNIEYQITVDRRIGADEEVTYVFDWRRKHTDRASGQVVSANGRSEWMLTRQSGRFLLKLLSGTNVF